MAVENLSRASGYERATQFVALIARIRAHPDSELGQDKNPELLLGQLRNNLQSSPFLSEFGVEMVIMDEGPASFLKHLNWHQTIEYVEAKYDVDLSKHSFGIHGGYEETLNWERQTLVPNHLFL